MLNPTELYDDEFSDDEFGDDCECALNDDDEDERPANYRGMAGATAGVPEYAFNIRHDGSYDPDEGLPLPVANFEEGNEDWLAKLPGRESAIETADLNGPLAPPTINFAADAPWLSKLKGKPTQPGAPLVPPVMEFKRDW